MASFQGRSGADGIFKAFQRCCIIIQRYDAKLRTAIELTRAAGLITDDQALQALAFVTTAKAVCDIFAIVASNSGFSI